MALKDTDFKKGDRVRSVRWGKFTNPDTEYVGLEGTVNNIRNNFVDVKLDRDPINGAASCPFFPSELEHINKGETN